MNVLTGFRPFFKPVYKYGALVCAWAIVTGCSGVPQLTTAPKKTDLPSALSGDWVLDPQVSDDLRARLAPLYEKQERRWRTMEKRMEEQSDFATPGATLPASNREPSTLQWMHQQRELEKAALIAFISPPTQLEIRQATRDGQQEIIVKTDKAEGTRTLVPGQPSALFVGVGGFALNSGWQDATFVVALNGRGDNSMHVIQYYTVFDAGEQLEMRMVARLPELGKQVFRFVFKRKHT